MELRGRRNGWRTMRTNQRIYRAGGGHIEVRSRATLRFTDVGSYFGGSYWKVHQLARFELRRVSPDGDARRRRPHQPQAQLLPARPRADAAGPALARQPPLPRLQPGPLREARHPRHLGRLVRHLPRRLRQAVDRRLRPARLLRLHDDRRPQAPALRVERERQHLPAPGPPALHAATTAAELSRGRPRPGRWSRSPGERAPSRRIVQLPSSSIAATSTTVEGRPVSSPPSIARSAPATIESGTSSKRAGAGSPLTVGRGLEDRAHRPGERAVEQADAEPLAVLAAGERVAVVRVGDHQRDRPRQQGADRGGGARAEAGDQLPHRQRREVHDRRGLAVVAALEPVDALDRPRVERIAGEAVEAVGREDGDAAARRCSAPAPSGRPGRRRSRS